MNAALDANNKMTESREGFMGLRVVLIKYLVPEESDVCFLHQSVELKMFLVSTGSIKETQEKCFLARLCNDI